MPAVSSIFANPRRTASSLTTLRMPSKGGVTAQRRDVRIALMTGENRQQQRAEHVALARRIRTGERQRAVRHPAVEQATLLQVFDEKRQLTERRHRLRSIPLDVHPTAERVGNRRPFLNLRLLTRRVSQRTAKSIVISGLSADSAEARKVTAA